MKWIAKVMNYKLYFETIIISFYKKKELLILEK